MAIVAHTLAIPEMVAWVRLSHTTQIRFCRALMAAFGTDEAAINMQPDSEQEWAELRDASLVTISPSQSLRLTSTGQRVVMELVDHYLFDAPVATVC